MKCPECDGVGRIHYGEEWCSACNGTGEVEMTEQEYIQTCNTEQLARTIYELMWHKEKHPELCVYPIVDSVVEWLKQPHH